MKKIILLLMGVFVLSGCSLLGDQSQATGGGLYKTINAGASWQQSSAIPTTNGHSQSFEAEDIVSLKADPSDEQAIYFGSLRNGLFYSYNQARSWRYSTDLGVMPIGDIAVDHDDKCTVYVVSNNKIHKSEDCSRTWLEMYTDNDRSLIFTGIAVDHYNTANIFAVNSRGDVMKSSDYGHSWLTLINIKTGIRRIVISPHDSRVIMVATIKGGLYRSRDNGQSWVDFVALNKEFPGNKQVRDITPSTSTAGTWLMATDYGLFQTVNDGDHWTEIDLILPERRTKINNVAMSHQVTNVIYYVTDYNFYSSVDNGVNWTSRSLPTTRRGWRLLVDQNNDKIVYLGVSQRP